MPKEEDEYEVTEGSKDDYEVIPITPVRRLEKRMGDLERAGSIPQLQGLITQVVELIKSNQKIVNEVIASNAGLRNELSRLPPKIDDMISAMKNFLNLVEAAGRDEITSPGPEAFKPMADQLTKLVDQNQKLIENNQAILEAIDNLTRKVRSGTPVSSLLSQYPGLRLKRE